MMQMLVGIVSDTHGHFDRRLAAAFEGVQAILHAGDVGRQEVLERLASIAPVVAVRGNNDERRAGLGLALHEDGELGGMVFHLVHKLADARPKPGTRVVVFGHSHKPNVEDRDSVMFINPGAAGRVGFHRVQTVALMRIENGRPHATIVELGPREGL